jgi:hemerythrin-like domain-containing protein
MTYGTDLSRAPKATQDDARDVRRMTERLKRDHAMMRALLDDVERGCRALEERRPECMVRFRHAVWMLYVGFDEHLTTEEGYFAPLLRTVDAWGELRVVTMIIEHNDQRRIILELVERAEVEVEAEDVAALVVQARALVTSFRHDMESEEQSLDELVPSVVTAPEDG